MITENLDIKKRDLNGNILHKQQQNQRKKKKIKSNQITKTDQRETKGPI